MAHIYVDPRRFQGQQMHLAACIIGGEPSSGDYVVMCDELRVARITRSLKSFGRVSWDWSFCGPHIPDSMSKGSGSASSLEEAKQQVRAVFDMWVAFFGANPELAAWHD